jgi:hypothetical protein
VNRFGELIGFTVLPALLDVAVAVVVFIIRFELALGVVVGVAMNGYIWISVVLTKYRTRIRMQMDDRDAVSTLCIINSPMQPVYSLRVSPLFSPLPLCPDVHAHRSSAASAQTVCSITRLSNISVERSMKRGGMLRPLESIRCQRGVQL